MSHDPNRGIPQSPRWSEELAQALGQHVAEFREKLRMSAEDLSKATREVGQQIPRSTIQKIETGGKKSVQLHEALILAQAFGVPLGYLLYGVYNPGTLVRYSPVEPPKPAYWAADALTPVDIKHHNLANPISQAIAGIQLREILMSDYLVNAEALEHLRGWVHLARQTNQAEVANKLAELEKSIPDLEEQRRQINTEATHLEELGVEPWPIEEHVITQSYKKLNRIGTWSARIIDRYAREAFNGGVDPYA